MKISDVGNRIDPVYLFIGDYPSDIDYQHGQPLSRRYFRDLLRLNGFDMKNSYLTSVITEQNDRSPEQEIDLVLIPKILSLKPKCILTLGQLTMNCLVSYHTLPVSMVRGKLNELLSIKNPPGTDEFDDKYNINQFNMSTYSVEYVLKNQTGELGRIVKRDFEKDIRLFKSLADRIGPLGIVHNRQEYE